MKIHPIALLILLALALAACNLPAAPTGTATQLPTAPLPPSPTPETVQAPTEVPATPVPATAAAPGTGEPDRPEEAIMILEPAPGSRVTSPVRIMGWADTTFEQNLAVRVLTASGEQVAMTSTTIQAEMGQRGPFEVVLPLGLSTEENIFIQVYASSPRDGGVTHLAAVGVTFAPGGDSDIRTRDPQPEQIAILAPQPGAQISGGVAHVEGFALASFEQTLLVEVQDVDGSVIGSAPVTVQAPDLGQPGPFSIDVPYTLTQAGPGRIVVRDVSPAFGGDTHLSSVEVQLE